MEQVDEHQKCYTKLLDNVDGRCVVLNAKDVKCPICGTVNRSLDLDETDGWMECESCHNAVQILKYAKSRRVPVYQMADCNLLVPLSKKR